MPDTSPTAREHILSHLEDLVATISNPSVPVTKYEYTAELVAGPTSDEIRVSVEIRYKRS